jgi:toxin ParE1/3/4
MVQVRWLKFAKQDLLEIYEFIASDSKQYAKHQIEKIRKAFETVKLQPEIGKVVEEVNDKNVRELVEGNYRVIYRNINKNTIHILMIHHGARNLLKRLEK